MYQNIARHDQKAAEALVAEILKRGYSVSVHDSEQWVVKKSTDRDAILANMGETEMDTLRVRNMANDIVCTFTLIYGNGPGETVSDYTSNDEAESIVKACGF